MLVPSEVFRNFSFIGVDPGTSMCGIAIFKVTDAQIESVEAFTIKNTRIAANNPYQEEYHSDRAIKLYQLCHVFQQVLSNALPILVVSESPFFYGSMPAAFGALTEVVTMLRTETTLYSPVVPFVTYSPMQVKKTFGKAGQKGKEVMKEGLAGNLTLMSRLISSFDDLDEHSVDAIAVGYTWWLDQFNGSQ